ncbi:MAG: chemotaxis protein CheB [Sulfuricella sp.]|nr:chemotaxis protein CheB [Sulfuricella sp.]
MSHYQAVAIGCSTGGLAALEAILPALPADFPAALLVVMHSAPESRNLLVDLLARRCKLPVQEAEEKESVDPGKIYVAPPGYHLLIEDDHTFSLSNDAKVSYARPSLDVLFEAAADVYGSHLVGVVLTGANHDGAGGLKAIAAAGGLCLVQDPATAEARTMPESALKACPQARSVPLDELATVLIEVLK